MNVGSWQDKWREWFVKDRKVFPTKFSPKIFPDGSSLTSVINNEMKAKYMNKLGCAEPCAPMKATTAPQFKSMGVQTGRFNADFVIVDDVFLPNQNQEKANPMGYQERDNRTEAQQAKDYLILSLDHETRAKDRELQDAFHLNHKGPKTLGELREAIKNGWVSVDKDYEKHADDTHIWSVFDYLVISDPAKTPDRDGYKKAVKAMTKAASGVKDQIVVMGAEKGLEALNSFKSQTFH